VNVVTAGTYSFTIQLQAGSQTVQQSSSATLSTGSQQVSVTFPSNQMLSLGANGPYERINALLVLDNGGDDVLIADANADAGPTAAYSFSSFQPPNYFTGSYSSTPIDANGIPGYEILNIGVGIPSQPQGTCQGNADLYAGSTYLDTASYLQFNSLGLTSITFSFNGYRIRNAGLDGPYTLTHVSVSCPSSPASGNNLFRTPAYLASQFEAGAAGFSLTSPSSSVTDNVAQATSVEVDITPVAGFNRPVQFSVSGIPTGSTATFFSPITSGPITNLVVFTTSTPPGSYPLTITGTSGSLNQSLIVTYVVPPATAAPTFTPPAGSYNSAQSVTMSSPTQYPPAGSWVVYYTTDGTTPTFSNYSVYQPPYSDPITVSATTTITAFAWVMGYSPSPIVSATYTLPPQVAPPVFNPAGGVYTTTQTVSISTATPGATIRYTTDGSTPSETVGTVYAGPITVSATTTVNAIAYKSGDFDSSLATANYVIDVLNNSWYNAAWTSRKTIDVSYMQVVGGANLTNYPLLVSVTDPDLAAGAQPSGNDILFTASDGVTKLNHEIESYNPSTGQLIVWVRVPTLSAAFDTLVYMYFSNSAASNQQNPPAVWDTNYVAVYHFGSALAADSTANNNTGTLNSVTAVAGQIAGGAASNGGYIDAGNGTSLQITGTLTLETWVNPNVATGRIISKADGPGPTNGYELYLDPNSGGPFLQLANAGEVNRAFGGGALYAPWNHIVRIFVNVS
jgi:hypothetical protein